MKRFTSGLYQRRFAALVLATCLPWLCCGCNKDAMLGMYNDAVEAAGAQTLDSPEDLPGELNRSEDGYTGSYQAELTRHTGQSYLFGGTSIDKAADAAVSVDCEISLTGGSVRLIAEQGGGEPALLLEGQGAFSGTVPTPPGSCYIRIEWENFTGSVEIHVQ